MSCAVSDPMAICSLGCSPVHGVVGPWAPPAGPGPGRGSGLPSVSAPGQEQRPGSSLTEAWGPRPQPSHCSGAFTPVSKVAALTQRFFLSPCLDTG